MDTPTTGKAGRPKGRTATVRISITLGPKLAVFVRRQATKTARETGRPVNISGYLSDLIYQEHLRQQAS